MSFPPATEMFQFAGFASHGYGLTMGYPQKRVGCPIRRSRDHQLLALPPGFSQRATSFIASRCQGIHQMPFSSILACAQPQARGAATRQRRGQKTDDRRRITTTGRHGVAPKHNRRRLPPAPRRLRPVSCSRTASVADARAPAPPHFPRTAKASTQPWAERERIPMPRTRRNARQVRFTVTNTSPRCQRSDGRGRTTANTPRHQSSLPNLVVRANPRPISSQLTAPTSQAEDPPRQRLAPPVVRLLPSEAGGPGPI